MTTNILIVYASNYGNTEKTAKAIAEGVEAVSGCESVVKTAEETTALDCTTADAIVVGTPVHMGSPDHRVKKWIDDVCGGLWMEDKLCGKVGAVFATGSGFGNAGGGCELTMLSLLSNLAELGMIIVPLPKNTEGYADGGLQWGSYARSATPEMEQVGVNEKALLVARNHGTNVARVAKLLGGKNPFDQTATES
ncbi:MAG: flavodoxin domain-containing protein [Chthoniobacterales bacterium]